MFSYDLTREPWIPCAIDQGIRQFSLSDVLTEAHNIREIIGENPPVTIALHRLLLAIIHRSFRGPKDADAWAEMYEAGKFDAGKIHAYFAAHQERFDLFHDKYPFYQTASAREKVKEGAVIQLYFQAKANATLFDHSSTKFPKVASPSEAARLILMIQAFDTTGTKTAEEGKESADAAPLIQSAIALIRGKRLFETLMFNLHRYNGKDDSPFHFDENHDIPAWERDARTISSERWPDGPIDLLTWQSRQIALQPEQDKKETIAIRKAVIMPGFKFPKAESIHNKETMLAYRTNKDGKMLAVGFYENRSLWRNSDSLLQTVAGQNSAPKTLSWLNDLVADGVIKRRKFPVDFLGIAADKARLLFWDHQRFDLPLDYLNDHGLTADLSKCLNFAEEIGSAVRAGTKSLADKLGTDRTTFFSENQFWAEMELRFHRLLGELPDKRDDAMTEWFADALETARRSLRKTIDSLSGTTAEMRASVDAENMLRTAIYGAIKRSGDSWQKYLPKQLAAKGGKK